MSYCDLDGFKSINDRFEHREGDFVLRQFGAILRSAFRSSNVLSRLGGDEFVVMLTNADPSTNAAMVRIERELAAFAKLIPRSYSLGCSLGLVS